jgi:hypothetical protein
MFFRFFIFYIILSFQIPFHSQIHTFKSYVDTLCSPYFKGRGYIDNGHLKTAIYLANEFKEIGLEPLNHNSYFQEFPLIVNTFPSKIKITKNGISLREGIDFILDPSSKSINGKFNSVKVNLENYKKFLAAEKPVQSNNIYVLDVSKIKDRDSISLFNELKLKLSKIRPVIVIQNSKLTWSVSSTQNKFPIIYFSKNIICDDNSILEISFLSKLNRIVTNNVCGKLKGKRKTFILITAHYDHLGMMGNTIFPGANDNASGLSILLNLAKYYTSKINKHNIIFICFGAEELGLLGSNFFVNNPLIPLKKVKFLINLDIVGTGDEGLAIVNAIEQKKQVKEIGKINNKLKLFPKIKIRGQAPNSDHYWFSKNNVPAIFLYTMGGIKAYHDPLDKSETLPLSHINELFILINTFLDGF